MARHRPGSTLACVLLAAAGTANAMYYLVDVDQVPIARLTENLEKRLEKNPGDVKLLLNLARLHAMAFATKSDVTNIVSGTLDPFFGYARDGRGLPFTRKRIAWELAKTRDKDKATAASDHLTKAITTYRKLVQIEPQNGMSATHEPMFGNQLL